MKLDDRIVVVHLSDEGRRVLRQVGVEVPNTPGVSFDVEESNEEGGGGFVSSTKMDHTYCWCDGTTF